jgi:hypothetical protein
VDSNASRPRSVAHGFCTLRVGSQRETHATFGMDEPRQTIDLSLAA